MMRLLILSMTPSLRSRFRLKISAAASHFLSMAINILLLTTSTPISWCRTSSSLTSPPIAIMFWFTMNVVRAKALTPYAVFVYSFIFDFVKNVLTVCLRCSCWSSTTALVKISRRWSSCSMRRYLSCFMTRSLFFFLSLATLTTRPIVSLPGVETRCVPKTSTPRAWLYLSSTPLSLSVSNSWIINHRDESRPFFGDWTSLLKKYFKSMPPNYIGNYFF